MLSQYSYKTVFGCSTYHFSSLAPFLAHAKVAERECAVKSLKSSLLDWATGRRGPSIGARGGTCPPPQTPRWGGALGGHRRRAALWCFIRSCNAELRTLLLQFFYYWSKCTTYKMYRTYTRTFQFAQNFTHVLNKYNYAHSYSRIHIHTCTP